MNNRLVLQFDNSPASDDTGKVKPGGEGLPKEYDRGPVAQFG
jgi:hypothetical protein